MHLARLSVDMLFLTWPAGALSAWPAWVKADGSAGKPAERWALIFRYPPENPQPALPQFPPMGQTV
jgi:hypothetical protein